LSHYEEKWKGVDKSSFISVYLIKQDLTDVYTFTCPSVLNTSKTCI